MDWEDQILFSAVLKEEDHFNSNSFDTIAILIQTNQNNDTESPYTVPLPWLPEVLSHASRNALKKKPLASRVSSVSHRFKTTCDW